MYNFSIFRDGEWETEEFSLEDLLFNIKVCKKDKIFFLVCLPKEIDSI